MSKRVSHSVVSNSLRPNRLWPTRLLCPWDSPGKNTGVGSHSLLQGIFPTQDSNPSFQHCRQILYHLSHTREVPISSITWSLFNMLSICELLRRRKGFLTPAWNASLLSKMLLPLGLVKSQLSCHLSSGCWNRIPGTGRLNDRRLFISLHSGDW